ncbi:MAG: hypothetical protein OXU68_15580 [Bacteroidota bacterium]|nr:hypothetical protein [Bacteroidota bacterium]
MKKLILLIVVVLPNFAIAQEKVERKEDGWVVVKDSNGKLLRTYYSPTPQMALEAVRSGEEGAKNAAWTVFSQRVEKRSAAELDAFADELARLVLESPIRQIARDALDVLRSSITAGENGSPYERGLDVIIGIYKALDGSEALSKRDLLRTILYSDGGEDYLLKLFKSLERPETPCALEPQARPVLDGQIVGPPVLEKGGYCPYKTEWCDVAFTLARKVMIGGEVEGVDPVYVMSICDKRWIYMDGRWIRIVS